MISIFALLSCTAVAASLFGCALINELTSWYVLFDFLTAAPAMNGSRFFSWKKMLLIFRRWKLKSSLRGQFSISITCCYRIPALQLQTSFCHQKGRGTLGKNPQLTRIRKIYVSDFSANWKSWEWCDIEALSIVTFLWLSELENRNYGKLGAWKI